MKTAYADPSVEHFHEWRKRVKYLRHQTEVISAVEPGSLSMAAGRIESLGERLGLDHDLADLAAFVDSDRDGSTAPQAVRQIVDAIGAFREEIQTDLAPTALRLYGPSTREFVAQMTKGWEEWHDIADPNSQVS
jgi:CHAD domain-containing protein